MSNTDPSHRRSVGSRRVYPVLDSELVSTAKLKSGDGSQQVDVKFSASTHDGKTQSSSAAVREELERRLSMLPAASRKDRPRQSVTSMGQMSPAMSMSKGSLFSEFQFDSSVFDIIKGPVESQLRFLLLWFGILLVISNAGQWSNLWYWTLPAYFFAAFVVIEVDRVVFQLFPSSFVPLYLTHVPYLVFHLLSGEAHTVFGPIYFVSMLAVFLQMGHEHMGFHVIAYCASYIVVYIIGTVILGIFWQPHDIRIDSVAAMSATFLPTTRSVGISLSTEAIVIFTIGVICLPSYILQQFIREYANNLIERRAQVSNLHSQNAALKSQLKAMKKDVNLDLDSPITKVIKSIREIQDKATDADVIESLDYVIQILSSGQLFMPNLKNNEAIDSDVNKWLNNMFTNEQDLGNQSKVLSSRDQSETNSVQISLSEERYIESDEITEALRDIDTWDFDIFKLRRASGNRPLFYVSVTLFEKYCFGSIFNITNSVAKKFFAVVESNYRDNPYHNSTHAADVMQTVHYFINQLGMDALVTVEEILAAMIAASVHDVDHPGFNNAFMINSSASLALRYNDQAVLENHHCAKAFEILLGDRSQNILSGFSQEKFKQIRTAIVSMVLATDMAGHFEFIAKFKNKVSGAGFNFQDQKDRQLILDIAIKCADICNPTKKTELCVEWANQIMEEFFKQGDEEARRGLPVSMFMDRKTTVMSKCQIGFIDYIVTPLFEVWDTYMNEDGRFPALENLAKNREYWKRMQETDTKIFISVQK